MLFAVEKNVWYALSIRLAATGTRYVSRKALAACVFVALLRHRVPLGLRP